ncbi:unnamed protein product [Vitrella brassicaformis CCMP3155]|uniref:IkappaB kinase n=2 Tax=Vitrella brassicaformis TaxID=1169539 RepID=A0A0G4GV43_VITBC|nr:unnamed protein product [Vitrella brassicaformis CCMP3155]|eukprot:CEM34741.1 unnamed protein product [Vitrella brassicaformis CCMP3155]
MAKRKREGERATRCVLRRWSSDSSSASTTTEYTTLYFPDTSCECDFAYRMPTSLGEGGNGNVYKAIQQSTGTMVAVKEAKTEDNSAAARISAVRACRKEVRLMELLGGHKHVVKLIATCTCATTAPGCQGALMMELCDDSLHGFRCQSYPAGLPPAVLRRVLRQLLSAMAHLEQNGVWHCDIKPENILVKHQEGCTLIKLADFGNSREVADTGRVTETEMQTPSHRAPEVHLKAALAAAANGECSLYSYQYVHTSSR